MGPKIEGKSIKKQGRKLITEKRGKKRPKEVDGHAGGRKLGPRGEGEGDIFKEGPPSFRGPFLDEFGVKKKYSKRVRKSMENGVPRGPQNRPQNGFQC